MEKPVVERIEELDHNIRELKDKISELQSERYALEEQNNQYFVGRTTTNQWGSDYWDEYFYPLGFISEADAKKWCEENNDRDYCPPKYFQVTKEEHGAIMLCARANAAISNVSYSGMNCEEEVISLLHAEVKRLLEGISIIEYPSFQHIRLADSSGF